ncbi:uncharacterized protein LOC117176016 [Belonocnema kinseyi]|uniref:uncharacterized protein LOC117176016 n=1 Tax=Belonocnema kinseyi TaxID=2817044 RepID=UPI00143DF589|nr:uncharacterized protein LOC117176016 [Belonocnema kinseyi]
MKVTLTTGVIVCQKKLRTFRSMSQKESIFVGDLAELILGKQGLMINTVKGRSKGKGKLCSLKIEAIRCEFERWMIQDIGYGRDMVCQQLNKMTRYINLKTGWLLAVQKGTPSTEICERTTSPLAAVSENFRPHTSTDTLTHDAMHAPTSYTAPDAFSKNNNIPVFQPWN